MWLWPDANREALSPANESVVITKINNTINNEIGSGNVVINLWILFAANLLWFKNVSNFTHIFVFVTEKEIG